MNDHTERQHTLTHPYSPVVLWLSRASHSSQQSKAYCRCGNLHESTLLQRLYLVTQVSKYSHSCGPAGGEQAKSTWMAAPMGKREIHTVDRSNQWTHSLQLILGWDCRERFSGLESVHLNSVFCPLACPPKQRQQTAVTAGWDMSGGETDNGITARSLVALEADTSK